VFVSVSESMYMDMTMTMSIYFPVHRFVDRASVWVVMLSIIPCFRILARLAGAWIPY
jgi:hypothetical protein